MSDFDIMNICLAAAAHDMDHPGHNNVYETKTRSKLALLYNDSSVLESHHTASFFFMLENGSLDCDVY